MSVNKKYDYTSAGFNGLLSRSIKANPFAQTLSDGASTPNNTINLDKQQLAASLGNILKMGRISLDGVKGRIIITDKNGVETAWLGDLTP